MPEFDALNSMKEGENSQISTKKPVQINKVVKPLEDI